MPRIKNMGTATMKFNEGVIVTGSAGTDSGSLIVTGSIVASGSQSTPTLDVYGNLSNQYVAVIDNDQSSGGHVLKLLTDGNGSGTRVLEMEDGDGDIIFRARADGRFGFGPDGVSSMGAGTFVVGIDNSSHTSDIAISQRLQHLGDSNTYLDFPSNDNITLAAGGSEELKIASDAVLVKQYIKHIGDENTWINFSDNRIRLNAGGNNFVDCQDNPSAPHKVRINNGGNNIDFVIKDNSGDVYFTADASTSRVTIGTDAVSNSDVNFLVSGSIGSKDSTERGTAVFGGDLVISGGILAENNVRLRDSHGRLYFGQTNNNIYMRTTDGDTLSVNAPAFGLSLADNSGNTKESDQFKIIKGGQEIFKIGKDGFEWNRVGLILGTTGSFNVNGLSKFKKGLVVTGSAGEMSSADSEYAAFHSSGSIMLSSESDTTGMDIEIQTKRPRLVLKSHAGSSYNPAVVFDKFNDSGDGSMSAVASGMTLSQIDANGFDGAALRNATSIKSVVDGTPGSGDMPGRLEFRTSPDGSASVVTRMTIKNDGNIGIGTDEPAALLHVNGTTDTSPSNHGLMVLGPTNGQNISIDQNEIMARNNGSTSTLFLNYEGGNVAFGGAIAGPDNTAAIEIQDEGYLKINKGVTFARGVRVTNADSTARDHWVKFASILTAGDNVDTAVSIFLVVLAGFETSPSRELDGAFLVTAKFTTLTASPYYDPQGTYIKVEPLSADLLESSESGNPFNPQTDIFITWESDSSPLVDLYIKATAKNKECFVTHLGGTGVTDTPDTDPGFTIQINQSWSSSEPGGLAGGKIFGTWASKVLRSVKADEGILTGTTGSMENTAILQADSTTKGFLPPRMTTTQRDAIGSPASGLIIYNSTTNKLNVYTGSGWEVISSS